MSGTLTISKKKGKKKTFLQVTVHTKKIASGLKNCILCVTALFLCERNLHGIGLRDFKALQRVSSGTSLNLVLKLHEGDVVAARDQTHLLEPWEPV